MKTEFEKLLDQDFQPCVETESLPIPEEEDVPPELVVRVSLIAPEEPPHVVQQRKTNNFAWQCISAVASGMFVWMFYAVVFN